MREESERVLRQMLSTLETTTVDWTRAAEPPPALSSRKAVREMNPISALTGVPYDRSAAYDYAEIYWDGSGLTNDDGCTMEVRWIARTTMGIGV